MNLISVIYIGASFILTIAFVLLVIGLSSNNGKEKNALTRIKNLSSDMTGSIEAISRDVKSDYLSNLLLVNGLSIKPFDFFIISLLVASIISVLIFLSLRMLSLTILIFVFGLVMPTIILNIMALKKHRQIDVEVIRFIKLLKERAISSSNVNLLFQDTLTRMDDSILKRLLTPIAERTFKLNEPLYKELQNLGFAIGNENLLSLSYAVYRNREDGTNIKSLLVKFEEVMDIENNFKISDDLQLKPHIYSFIAFVVSFFIFVFGVKYMMPSFYAIMVSHGFSANISASLIFLILQGLTILIASKR